MRKLKKVDANTDRNTKRNTKRNTIRNSIRNTDESGKKSQKNRKVDTENTSKTKSTKLKNLEVRIKKNEVSNAINIKNVTDTAIEENEKLQKDTSDFHKSIIRVIYIFLGLFIMMIGYYVYFIMIKSPSIINSSYNKRQAILETRVLRGQIQSAKGDILAETVVDEDGNETRVYPYKELFAHVVGRYTRGIAGLEEVENIHLLTSDLNTIATMYNDLLGIKNPGNNVITTLDVELQEIAYKALGNNRGAVVVMEPTTGKIIAMVSNPSYDPNVINKNWDKLVSKEGDDSPLLNRATQGLYPPGSTFKVLTSLEYMRENVGYEDYHYNCNGKITYNGMTVRCYNNKAHGKIDLSTSLAKSCNTSYASIAMGLNLDQFYQLCETFLFNQKLPIALNNSASSYTLKKSGSSVKEAMQTAIGQGKILITPLHNAMIVSTVANGGIMMTPYMVDRIENANGLLVKRYQPQINGKLMTVEEAEYIASMMKEVVDDGTATSLKGMKVSVAGKTGSADQANKKAHAWFIGYAPVDHPKIAVSIIVENKGTGSDYAVPIAKKIFTAYFK